MSSWEDYYNWASQAGSDTFGGIYDAFATPYNNAQQNPSPYAQLNPMLAGAGIASQGFGNLFDLIQRPVNIAANYYSGEDEALNPNIPVTSISDLAGGSLRDLAESRAPVQQSFMDQLLFNTMAPGIGPLMTSGLGIENPYLLKGIEKIGGETIEELADPTNIPGALVGVGSFIGRGASGLDKIFAGMGAVSGLGEGLPQIGSGISDIWNQGWSPEAFGKLLEGGIGAGFGGLSAAGLAAGSESPNIQVRDISVPTDVEIYDMMVRNLQIPERSAEEQAFDQNLLERLMASRFDSPEYSRSGINEGGKVLDYTETVKASPEELTAQLESFKPKPDQSILEKLTNALPVKYDPSKIGMGLGGFTFGGETPNVEVAGVPTSVPTISEIPFATEPTQIEAAPKIDPIESLSTFVSTVKDQYGKDWRKSLTEEQGKQFKDLQMEVASIPAEASPVVESKGTALLIPGYNSTTGVTTYEWMSPGEKTLSKEFATKEEALANKPEGKAQYLNEAHQPFEQDIKNVQPRAKAPLINEARTYRLDKELTVNLNSDTPITLIEAAAMFPEATLQKLGNDFVFDSGNTSKFRFHFDNIEAAKAAETVLKGNTPSIQKQLTTPLESQPAQAQIPPANIPPTTVPPSSIPPIPPDQPTGKLSPLSLTERATFPVIRNLSKANPVIGALVKKYDEYHTKLASEGIADVREATKGVNKAGEQKIIRFLDGEKVTLDAHESAVATKLRTVLDSVAMIADENNVLVGYRQGYFPRKYEDRFEWDTSPRSFGTKNAPYGSLEKSRKGNRQNFRRSFKVLEEYVNEATRRVSEARYLGKDLSAVSGKRYAGDPATAAYVGKAVERVTGRERSSTPSRFADRLRHITALGDLAFASIYQPAQVVHTASVVGTRRAIRAAVVSLKDMGGEQLKALRSGALWPSISHEVSKAVGDKGYMHGIPTLDKAMRVHANVAGRLLAQDALKGNQYAKSQIENLRLKLTDPDLVNKAGKAIADKTQFRTGTLDLPLWSTSPLGKLATQYSSFAYAHARFATDMFKNPRKNFGQIMRFAGLGLIAGELVGDLREGIKALIPGKDEEDEMLRRILESAAGDEKFDGKDWLKKLQAATRSKRIPISSPAWRAIQNLSMVGGVGIFQNILEKIASGRYKELAIGPAGTMLAETGESLYKDIEKTGKTGKLTLRESGRNLLQNLPVPLVSGYKLADYFLPKKEGSKVNFPKFPSVKFSMGGA